VSLVAVWRNEEESPSIWVATDSRISDRAGVLLDEGGKLFSVPVLCRRPGDTGLFSVPYFSQEVGLACVGGSLVYQQVYACLVPVLSNLIAFEETPPSQEDVAGAVARVTTWYVMSLGQRDPAAHGVGLVLAGYCAPHARQEAYRFEPRFEEQMFRQFEARTLSFDAGTTHFFGDRIEVARQALAEERERVSDEEPILLHRAPLRVLRQFIDDPQYPTIGGDVQLGFVSGANFTRVATVAPRVWGQPEAYMRLNNIDLDDIGPVGPCQIGLGGMTGLV
jgi:hypothetical protein